MHSTIALLLASGAAAQLAGQSFSAPLGPFANIGRRQRQSCEETYGAGSIPCGTENKYCYNPSLGHECCSLTDAGFCVRGTYCAPVAGWCCLDGETVEECASLAGFHLPSTYTTSMTSTVVTGITSTITTSMTTTVTIPKPSSTSTAPIIIGSPTTPLTSTTPTTAMSKSAPFQTGTSLGISGAAKSTGAPTPTTSKVATGKPVVTAGAASLGPISLIAALAFGSIAAVVVSF